jgi:hypothetical protein
MTESHIKKIIALLPVLALIFIARISFGFDSNVQVGFHYDWWEDTRNDKASQVFIPVTYEARKGNFSGMLLAAYANTHVEFEVGTESLSHMLDTKLNFTYEVSERWPVDVLFGLDFNLPTGKTDFTQRELILIMDPELISITRFGEGFNVNPTVVVSKEWGKWVAGAGAGYVYRGKYDFSKSIQDFDPGDIFATSLEVGHYFSPRWNARLFGHYVWYGEDKVQGEDFHQEGAYQMAGGGVYYSQLKWNAGFTGRGIFRDKSRFQEVSGGLFTEDNNSHGDEWVGDFTFTYLINTRTAVKTSLQGLYISKNDYPADSPLFIGRREKFTLGIGATRMFSKRIQAEVNIKGFVMDDAEANYPVPRDGRYYRGISSLIQLTAIF